jgi:hypothetical protein
MSRGLGKVQRQLLVILREHQQQADPHAAADGLDTIELTSRVYYGSPNCGWLTGPTQQVAVRRALAGLARQGLVFRLGPSLWGGPRCRWRVPPPDMVLAGRKGATATRKPGAHALAGAGR